MRACTLAIASFVIALAATPAPGGQIGDKKDQEQKKDTQIISASTEINGKTLPQWIAVIGQKDSSQTEAAVKSILLYGPELAVQAVPTMIAVLKKPPADLSVRTNIPGPLAIILGSLEKPDPNQVTETVALLKRMLTDPQIIIRLRSIQALAQLGPMARDATADLLKIVREPNSPSYELRNAAAVALSRVAYDPKAGPSQQVVDTLCFGLKDATLKVRLSSLESLAFLGAGQNPAYKELLKGNLQKMADTDTDPMCRLRAGLFVYPLLSTEAEKKKRRDGFGKFLSHSDHIVRVEAVQGLGQIGPEAKDQVPFLITCLQDKELVVVGWSAWALGNLGDAGRPAMEHLKAIVADMNVPENFRETAKEAIDAINGIKTKKKDDPKKVSKQS